MKKMINLKEVDEINIEFEKNDKLSKENFDFISQVGAGSFGKVYKVRSLTNKKEYALKVLSKNQIKNLKLSKQLENEIRILSICDHENISKLFGMFEDDNYVYLVLELANTGTLLSKLRKSKTRTFSEKICKGYMTDILKAIIYLHSKNPPILHRDIKPENILIHDSTLKIADFGWSNVDDEIRNTFCGTPDYLSPEMILGTGHNEKLDIWTLGILMFELLHGEPPFSPKNNKVRDRRLLQKKIEDNILKGKINFDKKLSKEAKSAIEAMLNPEQKERPNAQEVMELPFFKKKNKYLSKPKQVKSTDKKNPDNIALRAENKRLLEENKKQKSLIFNQKKNIEVLKKLINDKEQLIQKGEKQAKDLEGRLSLEKTKKTNQDDSKLKQDYKNAQKMINLMFHKSKEIIKVIDEFYNKNYSKLGESDKKNEISYEPSLKKLRQLFDDYSKYKGGMGSTYRINVNNSDKNKSSIGSTYHTNRTAKSAQINVNRFNDSRANSQNKLTKKYLANKQFTHRNLIKNENNLKTYFNR